MVGETPNLAARLQALAAPGSVVISQATRRLVGGLFELADLGPQRLKGFAEPLVRLAGRRRGSRRRPLRGAARRAPHAAGRARARARHRCSSAGRWAKDGEGQVVLLVRRAGDRQVALVRALRERLGDEPYTPLSHYCSPYHTNSALHPVIGLLERAARLRARRRRRRTKLAKLEALLARSTRPAGTRSCRCSPRCSGSRPASAIRRSTLTPEVQKRRTLAGAGRPARGPRGAAAGARAVRGRALDRSVDARAAGPGDRAHRSSCRVLVLITFRPEFQPPWIGQAHVTTLTMSRLGRRQGRRSGRAGHGRQGAAGGDRGRRSWPAPTACRCSSRS